MNTEISGSKVKAVWDVQKKTEKSAVEIVRFSIWTAANFIRRIKCTNLTFV
jgi:hypothetical protein